jgi:nucleoside-diphosphate-sugar epimerase
LKQLLSNDIFLSGSSGFVGKNLVEYLSSQFTINKSKRNTPIVISESIVIHLAGKAHDFRKVLNPDEYYQTNTQLTKTVYNAFLASNAKVFIFLSSVKAVADKVNGVLHEDVKPNPLTHYGKSKLLAERYILSNPIPKGKQVYILRPCMIIGPGNKGNLNLLYNLVSKGIPWPLGAFENERSFCSIDNLMFIIKELTDRDDIPSGVYNVADDSPLSTNQVISILAESQNRKVKIWNVSKGFIQSLSKLGDLLRLPLTSERLQKLTESYVVSNQKIRSAIGKDLPVSAKDGLLKTFNSFQINA